MFQLLKLIEKLLLLKTFDSIFNFFLIIDSIRLTLKIFF